MKEFVFNEEKYKDENGVKWNPWLSSFIPSRLGIKYNWPKTRVSLSLFNDYLTDLVKRHNDENNFPYQKMLLTKRGHFSFKQWGLRPDEKPNMHNSYIIQLDEKNNYIELMINDVRGSCIIYSHYDFNTTPEIFDINTGILVGWLTKN